jgi:hypothetical protein
MKVSTVVMRSRVRYSVIRRFSPRLDCWVLARSLVACDQMQLRARVLPSRLYLFLRDVAEEAWPGDCGTFVPCQGAVFQHSIESKAPGQRGRQGTRPNEGTALMTVTPRLDLPPMFAETRIRCLAVSGHRVLSADLAGRQNSSALGASWLRTGLPHSRADLGSRRPPGHVRGTS